jgi:predicted double-glycine peptidase
MRRVCLLIAVGIASLGAALPVGARTSENSARIMAEPGHDYAFPVRTLKEIKLERAFRTTHRQQFDFSCGSAALATLLTYHYGRPVDEATVFQAMFNVGDQAQIRAQGFSLLDMKRYLETAGFRADGVQVSLDELAHVGVPAIALVSDNGYRHFVVVKGLRGDRLLVGDPALGTRILTREQFNAVWVGGIFFVIRSHRDQARFNALEDWNSRLVAPLATGVMREGLGSLTLGIPDANTF